MQVVSVAAWTWQLAFVGLDLLTSLCCARLMCSLGKLVGNWDDAGNVLTVNPDGTFFEQQGNGCTITGAYTIIDPAHNLYGVSFLFDSATCTNSIAGIQFTGLAFLTPNSSSGWYHLLEDAYGVTASGAPVVVFDSITPYFAPPTG